MGAIVVTQDINKGTQELVEIIGRGMKQFGETYATIINQQKIADTLNRSVRTVYRQLESLISMNVIEMETRRGRNGGTVVVFNKEFVQFKSHEDNPITGNTKTAKELRDKYYPNKGTYIKDERTKEQKEKDRIRDKRRNSLEERMNANLRYKGYPDKEFFNMADNPKDVFKTYMASRAYNAVLLARLESWKNESEKAGNERVFELASKALTRYRNYDVMSGEFMGTQAYTSFDRLRRMIDERGYDLLAYMNNAFDTFLYLLKQGKNARPPFVNTIYSGQTLSKYEGQIEWKKGFEREHPYYSKPGDVNTIGRYYPITQIIGRAFKHPMEESLDMQTIIDAHLSNLDNTASEQMKKEYYLMLVDKVNSGDHTESEKQQTINFINEKISVQMIPNIPEADYIIANLRKILNEDDVPADVERYTREWYAIRGDIADDVAQNTLTNKLKVKRGYLIDFSVNGGATFENVWRVIENSSSYAWNINEIKHIVEELEEIVPLTKLGDIDLEQIITKTIPTKELEAQRNLDNVFRSIKEKDDSKYLEETLDTAPKMWYDVLEEVIGSSLRDGQSVTKETIRRA